jgi:hypothetical protein
MVARIAVRICRIASELPQALTSPALVKRLGVSAVDLTGGLVNDVLLTNPSLLVRDSSSALVAAREVGYKLSKFGGRLFRPISPDGAELSSRTWVWTVSLEDGHPISIPRPLTAAPRISGDAGRGEEDPRLFRWRHEEWAIWSIPMRSPESGHSGQIAIGRLRGAVTDQVSPLHSPLNKPAEKNWIPVVRGEELLVIYNLESMRVFSVENSGLYPVDTKAGIDRRLRRHSGSSAAIPWEGGWLIISHRWAPTLPLAMPIPHRFYTHYFVWLDSDFRTISVSRPFRFEVRGIEFCAGLAAVGEAVYISYGVNDARSRMIRTTRAAVRSMLQGQTKAR